MSKLKIAILDAKSLGEGISLEPIGRLGECIVYPQTLEMEIEERIKDSDILVLNKVPMNKETLKNAKKLKLICMTGTGTNHIDVAYCRSRNIAVTNVKGYCTDSVAQHTLSMVLYLFGHMGFYREYTASGAYIEDHAFSHYSTKFSELKGKQWGIIGLGEIGKAVGRLAKAFECSVVYYSTSEKNDDGEFERTTLEGLASQSDIITIHAPANERTIGMVDGKLMDSMKDGVVLVNTGRGLIINEKDLADRVLAGKFGGVGLDVIDGEPMAKTSPLTAIMDHPNVLITPHVAWAAIEARQRVIDEVALNIQAFIDKKPRNML